jgi:hypothetical protein
MMDGEPLPVLWGVTLPNFLCAISAEKKAAFVSEGRLAFS